MVTRNINLAILHRAPRWGTVTIMRISHLFAPPVIEPNKEARNACSRRIRKSICCPFFREQPCSLVICRIHAAVPVNLRSLSTRTGPSLQGLGLWKLKKDCSRNFSACFSKQKRQKKALGEFPATDAALPSILHVKYGATLRGERQSSHRSKSPSDADSALRDGKRFLQTQSSTKTSQNLSRIFSCQAILLNRSQGVRLPYLLLVTVRLSLTKQAGRSPHSPLTQFWPNGLLTWLPTFQKKISTGLKKGELQHIEGLASS